MWWYHLLHAQQLRHTLWPSAMQHTSQCEMALVQALWQILVVMAAAVINFFFFFFFLFYFYPASLVSFVLFLFFSLFLSEYAVNLVMQSIPVISLQGNVTCASVGYHLLDDS